MVARYVEGLKGEELQAYLGLSLLPFENLTRRADRTLKIIRKELSR
jgi:hypothetical protein